jgi:hypothetical protein
MLIACRLGPVESRCGTVTAVRREALARIVPATAGGSAD